MKLFRVTAACDSMVQLLDKGFTNQMLSMSRIRLLGHVPCHEVPDSQPPAPETTIEADDVKSDSLVASPFDENLTMSIESWLDQVAKKETGQPSPGGEEGDQVAKKETGEICGWTRWRRRRLARYDHKQHRNRHIRYVYTYTICMCKICTYIYIYIYIYTHIHTYIHTYIHACMHACMHACIHICIHMYKHIHIHPYVIQIHPHTPIHTHAHKSRVRPPQRIN